jgi:hypothetical protein
MGITDDLADDLAKDAIKAMKIIGDENFISEVSQVIGATSTTTQEAFNTAARVRLAEARARDYILQRVKDFKSGANPIAPPPNAENDVEH